MNDFIWSIRRLLGIRAYNVPPYHPPGKLTFFERQGLKYVSEEGGRTLEYGISTTPHPDREGECLGYLYVPDGDEFYLVDQARLIAENLRKVGLSNAYWQQMCYSHFAGSPGDRRYLFADPGQYPVRLEERPRTDWDEPLKIEL